jgi:hypothetical protein
MITYEIAPPLRHLTVKNRMGSRQHYYHFLLGVLLPLADYLARTGEATLPMMVRSCGPLDAILYELQLPRLMISDTESHQNLATACRPKLPAKSASRVSTSASTSKPTTANPSSPARAGWRSASPRQSPRTANN